MLLNILREYKDNATPGTLFLNDMRFCYTLELPRERAAGGPVCIPEGEYMLHLTFSPRFRRLMPQIMNVPGREGIRVHWGNFVKDTEGCPLVGYEKGVDPNGVPCVYKSKSCFDDLFRFLLNAQGEQVLAIKVSSINA